MGRPMLDMTRPSLSTFYYFIPLCATCILLFKYLLIKEYQVSNCGDMVVLILSILRSFQIHLNSANYDTHLMDVLCFIGPTFTLINIAN